MSGTGRPSAGMFFEPLIKVLGRLSGYEPFKGVSHNEAIYHVLREVGIDPRDSPWPLEGHSPPGLNRVIGHAFSDQRYQYLGPALCMNVGRDLWGLTEEGVSRAVQLTGGSSMTNLFETPSFNTCYSIFDVFGFEVKRDTRDDLTWVVVELSPKGEKMVDDGSLLRVLRRDLDVSEDHQVFIPSMRYKRGGKAITYHLMPGYVFVASGLSEVRYFSLERKVYVSKIVSLNGSDPTTECVRTLSVIPNSCVLQMRDQLRDRISKEISHNDKVIVRKGLFKSLKADVLSVDDTEATIHIKLRSREFIETMPKVCLEVVSEDDA